MSIAVGAVITGRVGVGGDFGAFVDLGAGVQGLLHTFRDGMGSRGESRGCRKTGDEVTVKGNCESTM